MQTVTQIAKELNRTPQTVRNHAEALHVGTTLGGTLLFTPGEANKIRQSIRKQKRGRPLGGKNKPKPKTEGDAT